MTVDITIVGGGALGSHLVQFLRSEDVRLHVIDFDRIEAKNLGSQFHSQTHKGKLKVESIRQTMQFLWGLKVQGTSSKLDVNNAEQLLSKSGLIVDCLDNLAARTTVQCFAQAWKIPCVHGALAADGSFGRVAWTENFVIDPEGQAGQPTCEDGRHLPFIAMVAAHLAMAVQEFVRNGRKVGFQVSPGGTFRV